MKEGDIVKREKTKKKTEMCKKRMKKGKKIKNKTKLV